MQRAFIILIAILPLLSKAQEIAIYPDVFTFLPENAALINPAYMVDSVTGTISAIHKARTGAFSKIATTGFIAEYRRQQQSGAHAFRTVFINENEGPYIHRPRASLQYAYRLMLDKNTSLSSGLSLGAVRTNYTAPSATGTTNLTAPDGNAGLVLTYRAVELGASVAQLFNSISSPINEEVIYRRFYHFFASYTHEISPYWEMKTTINWRDQFATINHSELMLFFQYNQSAGIGAIGKNKKGLGLVANVDVPIGRDICKIYALYNSPVFSALFPRFNTMEFVVGYVFR